MGTRVVVLLFLSTSRRGGEVKISCRHAFDGLASFLDIVPPSLPSSKLAAEFDYSPNLGVREPTFNRVQMCTNKELTSEEHAGTVDSVSCSCLY